MKVLQIVSVKTVFQTKMLSLSIGRISRIKRIQRLQQPEKFQARIAQIHSGATSSDLQRSDETGRGQTAD